jgi:ethylmalonyl-CoA/methylmalonyl-CoA decarboxylase
MEPSMLEVLSRQEASGGISLKLDGSRAQLTLQHSEKCNAMSASMMVDLSRAVDALDDWNGSLLILRGEGGHFCAGADLRLVQGPLATPEAGVSMSLFMSALLNRIRCAPYLSVAVVEGVAMGGGAELATATDFRLLSRGARLQFVQAKMGLSPGWGGAGRLVEIVGRTKALHLLANAQVIGPGDALRIGLADALFDPTTVEASIASFVDPICQHAPTALRACKKAIVSAARDGLSSAGERQAFAEVWGGPEQREAMKRALLKAKT